MHTNEKNANDAGNYLTNRRNALKLALYGASGAIAAVVGVTSAHAGYGQCSTSGCPCRGYTGSQQLCQNCGHQYRAHW